MSLNQLCRTCLQSSGIMLPLFQINLTDAENPITLIELLRLFTKLLISKNDGLPQQICLNCLEQVKKIYEFKVKCERSEASLVQYLTETVLTAAKSTVGWLLPSEIIPEFAQPGTVLQRDDLIHLYPSPANDLGTVKSIPAQQQPLTTVSPSSLTSPVQLGSNIPPVTTQAPIRNKPVKQLLSKNTKPDNLQGYTLSEYLQLDPNKQMPKLAPIISSTKPIEMTSNTPKNTAISVAYQSTIPKQQELKSKAILKPSEQFPLGKKIPVKVAPRRPETSSNDVPTLALGKLAVTPQHPTNNGIVTKIPPPLASCVLPTFVIQKPPSNIATSSASISAQTAITTNLTSPRHTRLSRKQTTIDRSQPSQSNFGGISVVPLDRLLNANDVDRRENDPPENSLILDSSKDSNIATEIGQNEQENAKNILMFFEPEKYQNTTTFVHEIAKSNTGTISKQNQESLTSDIEKSRNKLTNLIGFSATINANLSNEHDYARNILVSSVREKDPEEVSVSEPALPQVSLSSLSLPTVIRPAVDEIHDLSNAILLEPTAMLASPDFEHLIEVCPKCKIIFGSEKMLLKHIIAEHTKNDTCLICNSENIRNMHVHCDKHLPYKFFCDDCKKGFSNRQKLTRHLELSYNPKFVCEKCQEVFCLPLSYRFHLKEHKTETRSQKTYTCCTEIFLHFGDYQSHLRNYHKRPKSKKCESCSKGFNSEIQLRAHRRRQHHREKFYQCPVCSVRKKLKQSIRLHIRTTHMQRKQMEDSKTRPCNICFVRMESTEALIRHKRQHSKVKMYKCNFCDRLFCKQTRLTQHIESFHDRDRGKSFKCDSCRATFTGKLNFDNHLKSVLHLSRIRLRSRSKGGESSCGSAMH